MYPFVRRMLRAMFAARSSRSSRSLGFPWWAWCGVAILAAGWTLSWSRFAWFRPYQVMCSYFPIWVGFILVMNGLCHLRRGSSPLEDNTAAYLCTFPASSLFWWFFEYLNRYVWNWYYVGIEELGSIEYTIYATLCFSSVLPAVIAIADWLRTFPAFKDDVYRGMAKVDLRRPKWIAFLFVFAATGLTGIVFFPDYAYPMIWMSPLTSFLLVQFLFREKSLADRIALGDWSAAYRFAIAALLCGLCWETWNYYAYAKWIYAVPFVHRWQLWEMPALGFAGYLPFGFECAAVAEWMCPALVYGKGEV